MVITVFGLGFVGLTTALGFSEYGHTVYGVEIDMRRLSVIQSGKLPFLEPGLATALERHLNHNFHPDSTESFQDAILQSDCVNYCVGTPYGKDGQADLTYLLEAIDQTLNVVDDTRFRVLVTKSTIPPSTSIGKIIPFLEEKGITVGDNYGVANNPEFLREGHCWTDFMNADRIVLGVSDDKSENILRYIYDGQTVPVYCVSLNTLLATLISYSNEMSVIADAIGDIDIATAFRILHLDKRWGGCSMASYAYPGCGYGGYCLPKDTNALYAVAKTAGFDAKILKTVIITNDRMPEFITNRIMKVIGDKKNIRIAILGLSFKPESDDVRDTPSAKIIAQLLKEGYHNIYAYDPVANEEFSSHYDLDIIYYSEYEKIVTASDVFVIATAWDEFRDIRIRTEKPIIDCRFML